MIKPNRDDDDKYLSIQKSKQDKLGSPQKTEGDNITESRVIINHLHLDDQVQALLNTEYDESERKRPH